MSTQKTCADATKKIERLQLLARLELKRREHLQELLIVEAHLRDGSDRPLA
jgi:hypothetical protein